MNTTALSDRELISLWESTGETQYAITLADRFDDLKSDQEDRAKATRNIVQVFAESAEGVAKKVEALQEMADALTSDVEHLESEVEHLMEEIEDEL